MIVIRTNIIAQKAIFGGVSKMAIKVFSKKPDVFVWSSLVRKERNGRIEDTAATSIVAVITDKITSVKH